jgi:hypothetical protein
MRRASKYVIPWYKVKCEIITKQKYARLSLSDKGALHVLWSLAYSNHAEVGFLPDDLRIISGYLGPWFVHSPARTRKILDRLCELEWFDKHVDSSNMSIRYEVHHWQEHQASKFDVYEPIKSQQIAAPIMPVCSRVAAELQQNAENVVDNKGVPSLLKSKEKRVIKNISLAAQASFLDDDFEAGINEIRIPRSRIRKVPVVNEGYYKALLDMMEQSFERERKVPLKSISDKSDYIALHSMVARVQPEGFTLSSLQASWARFLVSPDRYHRSQSHPIRFFANNLGSFLEDALPVRSAWTENKGDRAAREVKAMMDELEHTKP